MFGYVNVLLFSFSLFTHYKGQKALGNVLIALFIIAMFLKKNREKFLELIDRKLLIGVIVFILSPFIISLIDGGVSSRIYSDHFWYWIIFFPLVLFINNDKKLEMFVKILLLGAIASMLGGIVNFLKNYEKWKNVVHSRVTFAVHILDYANIMAISLLFLISFLLFYKHKDKLKNIIIKIMLFIMIGLNTFILIVNKSRMTYVAMIPCILYILYRKKDYLILIFINMCAIGYYFLPKSISRRLNGLLEYDLDPSTKIRLIFWESAINTIKNNFWFGATSTERAIENIVYMKKTGTFDYIKIMYQLMDVTNITNTHNMYLHHLANYGIIGFLSVIYLFFIVIPSRLLKINFSKYKDLSFYLALEIGVKTSLVAYAMQCLFEFNFHKKPMIYTITILLFFVNYLYKKVKKLENENIEIVEEKNNKNKKIIFSIITTIIILIGIWNYNKKEYIIHNANNVVMEINIKSNKILKISAMYSKSSSEVGYSYWVTKQMKKLDDRLEIELKNTKNYKRIGVYIWGNPENIEIKSIKIKGTKNVVYTAEDIYENSRFVGKINKKLSGNMLKIQNKGGNLKILLPIISEVDLYKIRKNLIVYTLLFSVIYLIIYNFINLFSKKIN